MQRLRWREKSYPGVIFLFFLVVYILYPTNLTNLDGLYYASHVEKMPLSDTFHPHHLLFLTITQILFASFHSIFQSMRGLEFFSILNSILAAITLVYIYRILLSLFKSPLASFLGAFFYGSTFGFWHSATDSNIYIGFNLLLTILLARYILDKDFKKPSHLVITALLAAFATLIHQLGIFTLIPVSAYLLSKSVNRRPDLRAFGIYIGVYLTAVIIPYLLVFIFSVSAGKPSIQLFSKWVTAYGSNTNYWPFLYHDIFYCVGVVTRSQFEAFFHVIPTVLILYRGGTEIGESQSLVNLFSFVLAFILMLIIERIHFINFRASEEQKILYRKLLIWMMPFFLFFWFFAPENFFYRILYQTPLVIFGAGLIDSSSFRDKKNIKPFLLLLVIFTFVYNAWTGIIPESDKRNNPYFVDSSIIASVINPDDTVIFADKERYLAATFRYYFDRECLHAMSRMRYVDVSKQELETARIETADYLREKYKKTFMTFEALQMGVMTYYFSSNNIPGDHPVYMLVDKDQLIRKSEGDIITKKGTLYLVSFEEPSNKPAKRKVILIPNPLDSWIPLR